MLQSEYYCVNVIYHVPPQHPTVYLKRLPHFTLNIANSAHVLLKCLVQ